MKGSRQHLRKRMMLADPNSILSVVVPETVQRKAEEWQKGTRNALQQKQPPRSCRMSSNDICDGSTPKSNSDLEKMVQQQKEDLKCQQSIPDQPRKQKKAEKSDAISNDFTDVPNVEPTNRPATSKTSTNGLCKERHQQSIFNRLHCTDYSRITHEPPNAAFAESFFRVISQATPSAADFVCLDQSEGSYSQCHSPVGSRYNTSWYNTRARGFHSSAADIVTCFSMDVTTFKKNSCPLEDCSKEQTLGRCSRRNKAAVASSLLCDASYANGPPLRRFHQSPQKAKNCPGREGLRPRLAPVINRPSRASVSRSAMRLRYRPWADSGSPTLSDMMTCGNNSVLCPSSGRRRESQAVDPVRVMTSADWLDHEQFCDRHVDLKNALEPGLELNQDVVLGVCQTTRMDSTEDLTDLSVEETVDFFLNMASPLGMEDPLQDTACMTPLLETQFWFSPASSCTF